jgi:dTDP-4-amino-4,6-dideoxygalactose transaminase
MTLADRIYLSPPHMSGVEQELVLDAFASNWIAPLGPHVDAFEADLGAATEMSCAVALNSGTAAIHLALIVLGVTRGDWVLCQSFTFAGTVNPVSYLGATPVMIDSEPESWNMDPVALREAIQEGLRRGIKVKAIIPVHLYGMPAKMAEIMVISREFGIPVIEDAAEALGSSVDGHPCGSFGDLAVLSFNGNKIITTSGGGALLSDQGDWITEARFLASQARDPEPHYQHSRVGYNYRLSNLLAAIGRGQLQALPQRVESRRVNFERYRTFFADRDGISVLDEPTSGTFSNRWLTTIIVNPARTEGVTRETIRLAMADANIETRPLWKPMHLQPVFKDSPYFGDGLSEKLFDQGLCLPSGSSLTGGEFERIFEVLTRVLAQAGR